MKLFKLLTWNILGPQAVDVERFKDRYPDVIDWQHRFKLLIQKIVSFNSDVICLQEVDLERRQDFVAALSRHGFAESSYESKGKNGGVIVLHKISRFQVVYKNNVKLIATEKSNDFGAAAWATFICKETQKEITVVSVHLHWKNGEKQLRVLAKEFGSIQTPVVFAGDLNIPYHIVNKQIVSYLNQLDDLKKYSLFEHSSWTSQPPHNKDPNCWESLDHVLFPRNLKLDIANSFVGDEQQSYQSDKVKTATCGVSDNDKMSIPSNNFSSDHLPVIVTFILS